MFQVNTKLKITFGDWLYFLGYQLTPATGSMELPVILEKAKAARFRFEEPALLLDTEQIDTRFQYGNYHLSKIGFEDFKPISASILPQTINMMVQQHMAEKIAENEIEKASESIIHNVSWLLEGVDEVYILDVGSPLVRNKTAPFATHTLFTSFIAVSKNHTKVFYVEIGSD